MFKGWDYTELADAWNVYMPYDILDEPEHMEYDPLIWYIELALKKADFRETRVIRKMANDVRKFCRALYKQGHT